MDITPPRDSFGVEGLKRDNARKGVKQTQRVEPGRSIAPSREWHAPEAVPAPYRGPDRRSGKDRRQADDRRHDESATPLDTRSHHERRTRLRRQEDRQAARQGRRPPHLGIDTEV